MDWGRNIKACVEVFHLLFMEQLAQKIDKKLYALKGGCNLRFFFNSIRYSEDIDLDIKIIAQKTLENSVDKILSGVPFCKILHTYGLELLNISKPKQTQTTQRWKILLKSLSSNFPINTKIEFSRRDDFSNIKSDLISKNIIQTYNIRPNFLSHYSIEDAISQKIKALIYRSQTQARDIFDLYLLFQSLTPNLQNIFSDNELKQAEDNALNLSFSDFYSQVVSYLEPEYLQQYNDKDLWDNILLFVVDSIKREKS